MREVEAIELDRPATLTRLGRCFDGHADRSIVQALLRATEDILEEIAARVRRKRQPLRGREELNRVVGRDVNRKKVAKHFEIEAKDDDPRWSQRQQKIQAEARLDGIYIVHTSLSAERLGMDEAVLAYKSLTRAERAFRSLKTTQLRVRPLYVYSEEHVRGHVFLCKPAYYVEWHLRRKLAGERTPEGLPVRGLRTLPEHLGTLMLNRVTLTHGDSHEFDSLDRKTPLQREELALLGVDTARIVSIRLTV